MTGEIESKADQTDEEKVTSGWLRELKLADEHEKQWRTRANKVIDRYRDEREDAESDKSQSKFNILYANTEVLKGVLYQRTPVPDVRRRFLDRDPVGKEAAQVLQRSLSFCVDDYDFDDVMGQVIDDYVLPGRGVAKVRYVPTFAPMMDQAGQPMLDDKQQPVQQVVYETAETEYVDWEFFRMSPAKRWSKVRWEAFGELLTRDELVAQFGDVGQVVPLTWAPKGKQDEKNELFKRALVWTIWDKTKKHVHVVAEGFTKQRLKDMPDPLGLKGFFPNPKPLYSIFNTKTMLPIPEYCQYQDQAIELDNLTARIDALTKMLKWHGITGLKQIEELGRLKDGEFATASTIDDLLGKKLEDYIWEVPIDTIAAVVVRLYEKRESCKQIIYEVTGLADVVRGVSQASETLGAQELKARYANSRIGPRQKAIQKFARDLYRLKAEIIAEKFSPETLAQMTGFDLAKNDAEKQAIGTQAEAAATAGQPVPPEVQAKLKKPTWDQVMGLLRSDVLRGFRVDIETDSTIEPDATDEQKNRIELLGAVTKFVQEIGPAVEQKAMPLPVAKELLSFAIRGFKVSPQIEEALDQLGDQGEADPAQQQKEQEAQDFQKAMADAELAVKQAEAREAQAKATAAEHQAAEAQAKAFIAQAQAQAVASGGVPNQQTGQGMTQ